MRSHSPSERNEDNKDKKFACDQPNCGFRSTKKTYLMDHKASVHSNDRPFECDFEGCGKRFQIRRRLNIHMKTHYDDSHDRHSDYPKIQKPVDKKYVCDEPGCTFKSPKSTYLMEHKATVHSNERPFMCEVEGCGKTFKIRRRLNEHMKTHSADTPFVCDFEGCGKAFKIKAYLTEHVKYHLEPGYQKKKKTKMCSVPGCNFAAQSNVCLERHRAARHSDERPFECSVCHKRFKLIYILQTHMKTHLEGADIYRCDWPGCDYTAIQLGNVETHKKYVHSSERNFPCDWPACEKRFKTRQDLNEHLKRHKDEKRHACSWPGCQYRSVGYSQLKYHMRTHSNYKPHQCPYEGCQWRFVSSSGLKKHMKTHNKQKFI